MYLQETLNSSLPHKNGTFSTKSLEIRIIIVIFAQKLKSMKTRSEYIQIIRAHAPELQSRFGIQSMSLFGSVARNEQHEGSDVDLFVKMPPKFFNYIEASEYLRNILECDVDLISDHRNLRPFFRKQIERDGINIFTTEGNSQRFIGAN